MAHPASSACATKHYRCDSGPIPSVSDWVLKIIERGYSFQFARRLPVFRGVVQTSVHDNESHVLQAEVQTLLSNGAVETVPLANSESGFYSRYFLIPKKDHGLRPILDLRHLNRALMRWPFRMLNFPRRLVTVGGSERRLLSQIAPRHRPFLRFAVLPFGPSSAPCTFIKCVETALKPL